MFEPIEDVTDFPVQVAKVQPPPLRSDTLARPRLLDWLQAKIHHRLVLLIAEAGYGKTTLLADFSRRTRVRSLWYRLDESDRGWAPFIAHLVAAGREHDPGFAPVTQELLGEPGPGGPSRDAVVGAFLRELPSIAEGGAAVILDDFHLVDDSEEVGAVARELISRAPERLSIVIASRRRPALPVARLRARGEVAELTGGDLRFDVSETDSLFRDAYHHPLDPETVQELTRRTEGWAASLQLVEAAVRDRNVRETRAFIRSLTAAEGDLYDYLAEEVIGHLTPEMQRFLMRVSLLETVEPELAAIAAELDLDQTRALITSAERFGLLSRRGAARGTFRFHPLVREFLSTRLARDESPLTVGNLHRAVASAAETRAWYVACTHYAAAGEQSQVDRVLDAAMPRILATGQFSMAARFVTESNDTNGRPSRAVILSRIALARSETHRAQQLARKAVELSNVDENVLANLMSILTSSGAFSEALVLAKKLAAEAADEDLADIGRLTAGLIEASVDGHLPTIATNAGELANKARERGWRRYEGIALLNLAEILRAEGQTDRAMSVAAHAQEALHQVDAAVEIPTAASIRAWALACQGNLDAARKEVREARVIADGPGLVDILLEFAAVEAMFGSEAAARSYITEAEGEETAPTIDFRERANLVLALSYMRSGHLQEAKALAESVRTRAWSGVPGRESWRLMICAQVAIMRGEIGARELAREAIDHARAQGAEGWVNYGYLLLAAISTPEHLDTVLLASLRQDPSVAGSLAELLTERLEDLGPDALQHLETAIGRWPERWRPTLRVAVEGDRSRRSLIAARVLDRIGTREDVSRLRHFARNLPSSNPGRDLGKALSRRLAPIVYVEDQGRVQVRIGNMSVPSGRVRRKVLALLCFLLTKPDYTAPRDEILDALWPDVGPEDALNSLNQTIYFLRRVFEPDYSEDLSPGYVHHDSELVWLDPDLVHARSTACARILASLNETPTPAQLGELSAMYRGRFALDFAYEDWAAAYRDTQHAAYLHAIEAGVRLDLGSGHFRRGIELARKALAIDPDAQQIERALLKLYQLDGSHAAAGEQYEHYAAVLRRDLDAEPPPIGAL